MRSGRSARTMRTTFTSPALSFMFSRSIHADTTTMKSSQFQESSKYASAFFGTFASFTVVDPLPCDVSSASRGLALGVVCWAVYFAANWVLAVSSGDSSLAKEHLGEETSTDFKHALAGTRK